MIEPAPLFLTLKERLVILLALAALCAISVGMEYRTYRLLRSYDAFYTDADVLNQYKKGKKWVLKLRAKEGFLFYTTSYEDLKDLRARRVRVLLFPKRVTFWKFMHRFYAPAVIVAVEPANLRYRLYRAIVAQHADPKIGQLFAALFLATPLSWEMRQKIASFGISHLVAISGFHLGIIAAATLFLFTFVLRPLFARLFPYANILFFASLIALVVSLGYLLFVGEVPSLVRSFVMMLFGFWLLHRHIRLLSFETLLWVVLVIVALFPRFAWSFAFWLSVAGVFMIYLLLHHFKGMKKWQLLVSINFFVFWLMLPLSFWIFHTWNFSMMLSPLLSLLFVPFYPVALLLHLVGMGGMLDSLLGFLEWGGQGVVFHLEWWEITGYIGLLFLATRYRFALYLAGLSVGVMLVYHLTQL